MAKLNKKKQKNFGIYEEKKFGRIDSRICYLYGFGCKNVFDVFDHSRTVLGLHGVLGVVRAVELDGVVADPVREVNGLL